MGNSPLVSIVMACYNDAEFVSQAVISARNQTYENIELIVIDDGSDIETKNVLRELSHLIDRIITQKNQGVCKARNKGIDIAKGEYVFILDSDDYLHPDHLQKCVSCILNDSQIKIVSTFAQRVKNNRLLEVMKLPGGSAKDFLITNCALGTSLYKRTDLIRINGYDDQMRNGFEDWELNLHLLKDGGVAKVIEEPLYYYRVTDNSRNESAKKQPYELLKHLYTKHQKVFIDNYDLGIDRMIFKIQKEEGRKLKYLHSYEYRLGKFLLTPFRYLEQIIRSK